MRGLAESNRNQLASDVRFLTAPLRFVWGMLPVVFPSRSSWRPVRSP